MKYKQYIVYTSVNFLGFWLMLGAQLTSSSQFIPVNDTMLISRFNQHEMRWCFGWLFVTGINTLFQSWYWRRERRETHQSKPKTKAIPTKVYTKR